MFILSTLRILLCFHLSCRRRNEFMYCSIPFHSPGLAHHHPFSDENIPTLKGGVDWRQAD